MRTSIIGAVSLAACLAAHAQTYDLSITMTGIAPGYVTGDPPQGVPDPGTFSLLAFALAGIGIARRRESD